MAPKGKSSASSGTRKKHARKAAAGGPVEEPVLPKEKRAKGKDKKNQEPRKKVYIPPVKPVPVQPDPLDTLGIAQKVPPELLVVLKRLAKKDSITKRRALEDLQAGWVDNVRREGESSSLLPDLLESIPVWLHHVPALFLHPSRRIRLLAVGLHSSLLHLPRVLTDALLYAITDGVSSDNAEYIIGAWCTAAHDVDRQVSLLARQSWVRSVSLSSAVPEQKLLLEGALLQQLWGYTHRTLLDPSGVYAYVNPPQAVAHPPSVHQGRRGSGRAPPTPVRKDRDEEASARARTEEEEENELDRNARLRIGACGAAEWIINALAGSESTAKALTDEFLAPFANPALWSALCHAQTPPFVQIDGPGFGFAQPGVRRAAWSLLQTMLRSCKAGIQGLVPVLSGAVLRSAWVEPDVNVRATMWQPLLTFLKDHPSAWEVEAISEQEQDADDSNAESDGSEDEEEATPRKAIPKKSGTIGPSQAYREFLQFLELGCGGVPLQGYPTVLIILATIPPTVISSFSPSPLQALFTSFWAALDGRALSSLDRKAASAAFLSSLLECLVLMVRRLVAASPEVAKSLAGTSLQAGDGTDVQREAAQSLLREQFSRAWEELSSSRLKIQGETAGSTIAKNLTTLCRFDSGKWRKSHGAFVASSNNSVLPGDLFQAAWDALSSAIRTQVHAPDTPVSPLVSHVLQVLQRQFEQGSVPAAAAQALTREIVQDAIQQWETLLESEHAPEVGRVEALVGIFDVFGASIFGQPDLAKSVDETIRQHTIRLLTTSPRMFLVYLKHRGNRQLCFQLWQDILRAVATHTSGVSVILSPFLDAAEGSLLPDYLKPESGSLDDLAGDLLAEALSGSRTIAEVTIVRRLFRSPDYFISQPCFQSLLASLISNFTLHFAHALRDETVSTDELNTSLDLIQGLANTHPAILFSEENAKSLFPDVFLFSHLLPRFTSVSEQQQNIARDLWRSWLSNSPYEVKSNTLAILRQRIKELLLDCDVRPTAEQIVRMVLENFSGLDMDSSLETLPSRADLDDMLIRLPYTPADPSLAVVDLLVPPPSLCEPVPAVSGKYDQAGFSVYARAVYALLLRFLEDRHAAKTNVWALRHLLALSLYAEEILQSLAVPSPVFSGHIPRSSLVDIQARVSQIAAYLLSSGHADGWHNTVVGTIMASKGSDMLDGVGQVVYEQIQHAKLKDTPRESRIIHVILQHVLSFATKPEAEQWLQLARRLEKQAPHMSLAIIYSIAQYAPEPPMLDRYRNELAAGMLGVPPSKANTEGLWLLRRLAAVAPDPESDIIFLPQLRAVNLMKVCQQWIASDEDLDEEVESEMTLVFFHLAPILQNVQGVHWDLIFDVMENNLENASFKEASTLVNLSRTLRLLIAVEDLTSTNKSLRAVWQERETTCLSLVRDLAATKLDLDRTFTPVSVCRELALQIVQDLPESLMDAKTFPKMCHVITDTSADVQRMAYQCLHEAAKKYTEHIVIEAAVESEDPVKPELPVELLDILQRSIYSDDGMEATSQETSGYFLAWMLALDLFANASLKVKSGYIDQLRELGLVYDNLLPSIFTILGLYDGLPKAFKLDIWAIDEYYLDFYSPGSPLSLRLLAAHLYYRALLVVPSLIRGWLSDCRDRQLLGTITAYTAAHFSPAIVRSVLATLRDPGAAPDLADENFSVRVAGAVGEVTAAYLLDDHKLELVVRLPQDYPLHGFEVRDRKPVGVAEERWRAWVLGVQQILSFRSGSIVDGLAFFKKNITSYFEGLAECAICYSFISAMDGSLPRKPCKTCKNRFHAGCLYKWFHSSHSSSCPLCRSEIFF
ncbi:hypothetical protein IEO21_02999 [Rhodonia placenta]|uniref:E3 ubiquitin-protein ligase listerin n=1 Tax=Rhodonia placenta TaxID=104341 RepID=A0A8H7P6K7_9APHY|nr:hypothetical protein IEO21_02999 [Postia placenta]